MNRRGDEGGWLRGHPRPWTSIEVWATAFDATATIGAVAAIAGLSVGRLFLPVKSHPEAATTVGQAEPSATL